MEKKFISKKEIIQKIKNLSKEELLVVLTGTRNSITSATAINDFADHHWVGDIISTFLTTVYRQILIDSQLRKSEAIPTINLHFEIMKKRILSVYDEVKTND